MTRIAVLDFETSGMGPGDRAIEVGIVLIDGGRIIDRFESLMNPGFPVSGFIENLTGITNDMLADAPSCDDTMSRALDFAAGAVPCAHNAAFDRRFWNPLGEAGDPTVTADFLCTLLLARRLYPQYPNHKLATLAEQKRIPFRGDHHRALADAEVTAELLLAMMDEISTALPDEEICPGWLGEWQRMPCRQARGLLARS